MPSISVTIKQTEDILDEILRIIRHESENLNPVLSEPDQNSFVEEEERYDELYYLIMMHDANNEDRLTDSESVSERQQDWNR